MCATLTPSSVAEAKLKDLNPFIYLVSFFDEPVLLVDYVVQILDLQHFDHPKPTVQQQQAIHVL